MDTQSNQVSTNYDKDWVRNAPIPRFTFFDLINAAPGVNQAAAGDSRSTSLGSSTSDNSYQLDGTDFTAPLTGAAWPWPNTDAIEEIEVLSLGAPAEYGNLQGAVFNVVTRQGCNAFHGDANFYFQSDGLTSSTRTRRRTDAATSDEVCPSTATSTTTRTLQLAGPIVKDKLWFFGSYQYQRDYKSPVGMPAEFPNKFEADRVFGKINWQISSEAQADVRVPRRLLSHPLHRQQLQRPHRPQHDQGRTRPQPLAERDLHRRCSPTRPTSRRGSRASTGRTTPTRSRPASRASSRATKDLDTGQITGGIYSWYDGDIWKTAASVKVSHFADNFLGGSHDFKFGVQLNDGGGDYLGGYNDYIRTYGGVPSLRLRLRGAGPRGRQDARRRRLPRRHLPRQRPLHPQPRRPLRLQQGQLRLLRHPGPRRERRRADDVRA